MTAQLTGVTQRGGCHSACAKHQRRRPAAWRRSVWFPRRRRRRQPGGGQARSDAVQGQTNQPVTSANFRDDLNADGRIKNTDVNRSEDQQGPLDPVTPERPSQRWLILASFVVMRPASAALFLCFGSYPIAHSIASQVQLPFWAEDMWLTLSQSSNLQVSRRLNPCLWRGDFNGDGRADLALLSHIQEARRKALLSFCKAEAPCCRRRHRLRKRWRRFLLDGSLLCGRKRHQARRLQGEIHQASISRLGGCQGKLC